MKGSPLNVRLNESWYSLWSVEWKSPARAVAAIGRSLAPAGGCMRTAARSSHAGGVCWDRWAGRRGASSAAAAAPFPRSVALLLTTPNVYVASGLVTTISKPSMNVGSACARSADHWKTRNENPTTATSPVLGSARWMGA